MKIAFYTLGCKVNQYESQAMSEKAAANGYETVTATKKRTFMLSTPAPLPLRATVRHVRRSENSSATTPKA